MTEEVVWLSGISGRGSPGGSDGKESACNAGDPGLIPGSRRSPGEGNGLTLCDAMDFGPPGSSVHGILQARISELVAISSSRGSSQPRDATHMSCTSPPQLPPKS